MKSLWGADMEQESILSFFNGRRCQGCNGTGPWLYVPSAILQSFDTAGDPRLVTRAYFNFFFCDVCGRKNEAKTTYIVRPVRV